MLKRCEIALRLGQVSRLQILPDLLWNQGVRTALISDVPLLRDAVGD